MKPVVKGPGSSFGESPPEVNGFREEQVMVLSRHACDLGLGEMLRRLQKDYRTKRRQRLQKRGTGVDCDRVPVKMAIKESKRYMVREYCH